MPANCRHACMYWKFKWKSIREIKYRVTSLWCHSFVVPFSNIAQVGISNHCHRKYSIHPRCNSMYKLFAFRFTFLYVTSPFDYPLPLPPTPYSMYNTIVSSSAPFIRFYHFAGCSLLKHQTTNVYQIQWLAYYLIKCNSP